MLKVKQKYLFSNLFISILKLHLHIFYILYFVFASFNIASIKICSEVSCATF